MADARLRALARLATQGDKAARASLLVQRVRIGELRADRLRLAAWLGDPAALIAVGPGSVRSPGDVLSWLLDLPVVGGRDDVVLAFASAGVSQLTGAEVPDATDALTAVSRWLERPEPCSARLAWEAGCRAGAEARRLLPGPLAVPTLLCAIAAQLAGTDEEPWIEAARCRLRDWAELAVHDPRPAIRRALLPWALDEQVPVLRRA